MIQYRVLTLVGFGVLSMTSLFRDFTHSEEMTRKDVTVAYLRNEKDEVQKRLDTCQTNAARLERTFNLFVKSLNKKK